MSGPGEWFGPPIAEYDAKGRVRRIAKADGTVVRFRYDYSGARTVKESEGPGGKLRAGIPSSRSTTPVAADWYSDAAPPSEVTTMTNTQPPVPQFPFAVPSGYRWLVDRSLAGFGPNSALQPWYLLPRDQAFSVTDRWPKPGDSGPVFAFARRQDSDDLACFVAAEEGRAPEVVVVHGWTPDGYEVVARYVTIWQWLKSVVGDIEAWVALGDG